MNKHLYRVIFNRVCGRFVVVGELAHVRRGQSDGARGESAATNLWSRLNPLSLFTHLALGATVLLSSTLQADIVANSAAPLNQQPTISTTANGITQINIQTPSATGLSHNRYSRFDVDPSGAILNNARVLTQTQLGGFVLGNPNLATGTASVILNEVNASAPSQLRGFLEVAGDRAQVIVANPAGITCDGCGFINTDRATLTTGAPIINNGNLEAYVVRRGIVSIEGDGLDASQTNFTDVIARSVRINASLHAADLRITTGANRVNAANTTAERIEGEGDEPTFALDVSELGGMYAGKIRLVGTEQGVGVRNAGTIGASAGEFILTADGRLINSGDMTATTTATINTREGIDNSGTIAAGGVLDIDSEGELVNQGNAALFGEDVDIDVATVSNREEGGRAAVIAARNNLTIDADEIENRDGALLYSSNDTTLTVATLNNNSGLIDADGDINITANTINNTNENFQTSLVFQGAQAIQEFALVGSPNRYRPDQVSLRPDRNDDVNFLVTPEGESDAYNRFDYTRRLDETEIVSSTPAQIRAGGAINITADTVMNDNSRVIAGGVLTANIDNLINTETSGRRITRENGTLTTFTRRNRKGSDSTRVRVSTYAPGASEEAFSLNQAAFAGQTSGEANRADVPLGNSALFRNTPDATASFLIETDPRFTNQRMFLSSDFVLDQLVFDPAISQKRLGDGFYEQRLVQEQVAQLRGRRFLQGFADDESQFQSLLNAGITAVNEFSFRPGIALSSEQVAQLTSDVVLLIEREVTLPNGTLTTALVPQLYLRPQDGDLNGNGGLLAAAQVNITATQTIQNAASIIAQEQTTLAAETISSQGGDIRGENTTLTAQNDIQLQGGNLQGDDSLSLNAGRDIVASSSVSTQTGTQGSRQNINRRTTLFVTNAQSVLLASAGRDVSLNGVDIVQTGAEGQTQINAGRDIQLGTVTERLEQAVEHDANNFRREKSEVEVGSRVLAEGDIALTAGRNITSRGANLRSDNGTLTLNATQDIVLDVARNKTGLDEGVKNKSKGFASSTTRTRRDTIEQDSSIASVLSADSVTLQAQNINVTGSSVVATQALTVNAQEKFNINAATDTRLELNLREKKKSGLFSSGGLGVTLGSQQLNKDTSTQVASSAGSTLGSIEGNVNINVGSDFTQTGSSIASTQGDTNITAQNIDILAAENKQTTINETRFKQSGISLTITNPVVSAIQTSQSLIDSAGKVEDSRLQALAAATIALKAKNAIDAVKQGQAIKDGNLADSVGGINISISIGSSKSKTITTQTEITAASSTVIAGNNLSLTATGTPVEVNDGGGDEGEGDLPLPLFNNTGGDINIVGSELSAGNNAKIVANNALNINAQQNTATLERDSKSSSASVGIGFSLGSQGAGFNVSASASRSEGSAEGDDITFTQSRVNADNITTLESGEDITLKGGVVTGKQIIAKVGGDLNIESVQDTSIFKSKEKSSGFSVSIPITGTGGFSAGVNGGKSNIDSEFVSVTEQSGLKAGDEGFDVTVQGNTDLKGAVIASNQTAIQNNKNQLTTGTLTTSSLENKAEFEADAISLDANIAIKGSDKNTGKPQPLSGGGVGQDSGKANSTTLSGISGANITITDEDAQQALTGESAEQVIASLNTDVDSDTDTSNALDRIFDESTVQNNIDAQTEVIQAFSRVAPKAVADYTAGIARQLNIEALALEKIDPERAAELKAEAAKYDEGGEYRIALQVVVGGLSGGIDGAIGAGVAASSTTILDDIQKQVRDTLKEAGAGNELAKGLSQGFAQVVALGVGSAVGGTPGATSALAVDTNNRQLHLSETKALNKLQQSKTKEEQERLSDAACALAQCARGVPITDKSFNELLAKQQRGEGYQAEQAELLATGLFTTDRVDTFNDFLLRNDVVFVKGEGVFRAAGGVGGVVGGAGIALGGAAGCGPSFGISCAAIPGGIAIAGLSATEIETGLTLVLSDFKSNIGQNVLDSFNVETHPGDRNRTGELGLSGGIILLETLAAKIGITQAKKFYDKKFGKGGVATDLTSLASLEANKLIVNRPSELRNLVALSRVSVGGSDVGRSFTNFSGSIRSFPGIQNNKNGTFTIVDRGAFIDQVDTLFKNDGNPLNPVMKERILNFIGNDNARVFPTKGRGIPGLHAEVQAVNAALNKVPAGGSQINISVSTIDLLPGSNQGLPFPACNNCGGILSGFDILTGVKQ